MPTAETTTPTHPHETPHQIDEVVRHTDSGSGASQAEHWAPNVDTPKDDEEG